MYTIGMKKIILGVVIIIAVVMLIGLTSNSRQNVVVDNEKISPEEVTSKEVQTNEDEEEFIAPGFEASPDVRPVDSADEGEQAGEEKFSGILTEYNTGCFADGECYVVVDGKKITTIIGWSQDIVGSVQGFPDGDISKGIGEEVEVYASRKEDETFSLYGKESYYIKAK